MYRIRLLFPPPLPTLWVIVIVNSNPDTGSNIICYMSHFTCDLLLFCSFCNFRCIFSKGKSSGSCCKQYYAQGLCSCPRTWSSMYLYAPAHQKYWKGILRKLPVMPLYLEKIVHRGFQDRSSHTVASDNQANFTTKSTGTVCSLKQIDVT